MTMPAPWPDGDQILEPPIDALAIHILWHVAERSNPPRPAVRQQIHLKVHLALGLRSNR